MLRAERGITQLSEVSLTEAECKRLRRLNAREGWPPPATVRRWLGGGWNDALRLAQLRTVFTGDALVREIGPRFTREELLDSIRAYARESGERVPTLRGVIQWAKRPDVLARPGRRPQSMGPFMRMFESWAAALAAAGLVAAETPTGTAQNSPWATVRPTSAYGSADEQQAAASEPPAPRPGRDRDVCERS